MKIRRGLCRSSSSLERVIVLQWDGDDIIAVTERGVTAKAHLCGGTLFVDDVKDRLSEDGYGFYRALEPSDMIFLDAVIGENGPDGTDILQVSIVDGNGAKLFRNCFDPESGTSFEKMRERIQAVIDMYPLIVVYSFGDRLKCLKEHGLDFTDIRVLDAETEYGGLCRIYSKGGKLNMKGLTEASGELGFDDETCSLNAAISIFNNMLEKGA